MPPVLKNRKLYAALGLFVLSIALFIGLLNVYTVALGLELPKTKALKTENAALRAKAQVLAGRMDACKQEFIDLGIRDNMVYRSIFGLDPIPGPLRFSAYENNDIYGHASQEGSTALARSLRSSCDSLLSLACTQTLSYDAIGSMVRNAGDMAGSIPAICPVLLEGRDAYISSRFGFRFHPILRYRRFHKGMDFAMKPGHPVYATGDGVISQIKIEMRGYGRQVIVDHGFGYKTRYAHLKNIYVAEGMKVKRGEMIATTGNSGLSNGPHLHYEVIYKGVSVNPRNYFDSGMSAAQYRDIVATAAAGSEKLMMR